MSNDASNLPVPTKPSRPSRARAVTVPEVPVVSAKDAELKRINARLREIERHIKRIESTNYGSDGDRYAAAAATRQELFKQRVELLKRKGLIETGIVNPAVEAAVEVAKNMKKAAPEPKEKWEIRSVPQPVVPAQVNDLDDAALDALAVAIADHHTGRLCTHAKQAGIAPNAKVRVDELLVNIGILVGTLVIHKGRFVDLIARVKELEGRCVAQDTHLADLNSRLAEQDAQLAESAALHKAIDALKAHGEELEARLDAVNLPIVTSREIADAIRSDSLVADSVAAETAKWLEANRPKDGRDGVDVADLLTDQDGELVAVFTDGRTKSLGRFRGKDADMDAIERSIAEKVDAIPRPKDGFGFEDMDLVKTGERDFELRFTRGGEVKSFPLHFPTPIYRGVYKSGAIYQHGDTVTYSGALWIATHDTHLKPGETNSWQLAVKSGRAVKGSR